MNNLFSGSWRRDSGDLEMSSTFGGGGGGNSAAPGANLDKFFADVELVKEELKQIDSLHQSLRASNESLKTTSNASAVRSLRSRMDADAASALTKAKHLKLRLESLDRSNAANRAVPGSGPGSSTDRTRTSLVAGLRAKLADAMSAFAALRTTISEDYRETVERRVYTITGEKPDEAMVEEMVATGEGERVFANAIKIQGRGEVVAAIAEIQERHGAAAELERSLVELHQVFLDMSVMVAAQGEQIDDIEANVGRASSFVHRGTVELVTAKKHQRNSRKWTCIGIGILLVIILIIVIPIVVSNNNKK